QRQDAGSRDQDSCCSAQQSAPQGMARSTMDCDFWDKALARRARAGLVEHFVERYECALWRGSASPRTRARARGLVIDRQPQEFSTMLDVVLKRFDAPDETRVFEKGRFEIVRLGGMTIGRATYAPGWRWSLHVGARLGLALCEIEHVGLVV